MKLHTHCGAAARAASRRFETWSSLWIAASALLILLCGALPAAARSTTRPGSDLSPAGLTTVSRVNPSGIGTLNPEFGWQLKAAREGSRGLTATGYRILVASSQQALSEGRGDVWDSGRVSSEALRAVFSGVPLQSATGYFWKMRVWDGKHRGSAWSRPASFTTALLHGEDWKAHWIAASSERVQGAPLPIFRHGFRVKKPVARALLFVSGLGQYEARINGQDVTNAVLTPGWSDYRKHVFYDTFDVTNLLKSGDNAVGVLLGNGMYNVERLPGRYTKLVASMGQPKLILQMRIVYSDGSEETVSSDQSWKTTDGPVRLSQTYGGEDFDARKEPAGWDSIGFDDSEWKNALEVDGPGGALEAEQIPLIRQMKVYSAVKVTEPKPGVKVYDLGQNFAGWPRIVVKGEAGATMRMMAGELLDKDGLVTQASANAYPRHGPNLFDYTLKGGSKQERWRPRFSYYGFRYVQVETSGNASIEKLDGAAIYDAVRTDGDFSASNGLLTRIHKLIDFGITGNLVSVLTDCPHREKLGWLEQTQLMAASIMYNFDVRLLYEKRAEDIADEQLPDGMVPSTAPEYTIFGGAGQESSDFRNTPEWGSADILAAWHAYQFYGDTDILRDHYKSMQRYLNYLETRADGHIITFGLGDWYDIGPGAPGRSKLTSAGITATGTFYEDLIAMARIAAILGRPQDAAGYTQQAIEVRDAFNARFFHADTNQYDRSSQTDNAIPLALGMVPAGHQAAVLTNLVADIHAHEDTVTSGEIGYHYLVLALMQGGRSDVLYEMLHRTDGPGYGYQLAHGATALTEAWDANPHSSQDHFMLGDAEEWLYRGLAGIDFDLTRSPDERIRIAPAVVGDLESASASYHSALGMVKSEWSLHRGQLRMKVAVPAGATATVVFPRQFAGRVMESGKALAVGNGVKRVEAGSCVVKSGEYVFKVGR